MKLSKQQELIEYLISSPDTFTLCSGIVKYEYFDPSLQPVVKFILNYYEEHSGLPTPRLIKAETDVVLETFPITQHEISYVTAEIEKFCKQSALEDAIYAAVPLMQEGKFGDIEENIKAALMVSLQHDLGIEYFETVEERLERLKNGNEILPTLWPAFNEKLFGGPARKELLLFAASSGGGKSVVLSNLALDYATAGLNVLYISLELSEDIVSQRFDAMITNIGRKIWMDHIPEIINGVRGFKTPTTGRLDVVYRKSETKASEIRAFLKNYQMHYDCVPDVICVDYLDKLAPNAAVTGNSFDIDKKISEQLRQIGVDFNAAIITASQLNRSAVGEGEQNHSHIAGGISKINEADTFVTIYMNELMRAEEQMDFSFQKTRNSDGVGSRINMHFNTTSLKISDRVDNNNKLLSSAVKRTGQKTADAIKSGGGVDLATFFNHK